MNARQLFEPMLCETGEAENLGDLTASGLWSFEPKYDGMRVTAFKAKSGYYILNRSGEDVTSRFPEVLDKLELCPAGTIVDGEIVVFDGEDEDEENAKRGRVIPITRKPNFNRLQQRINLEDINQIFAQVAINPATFVVFDVYGVSGQLINTHSYEERKAMLDNLPVDRSPVFDDGVKLYEELEELGWEGMVAKKRDSKYEIGTRSSQWLKFKYA